MMYLALISTPHIGPRGFPKWTEAMFLVRAETADKALAIAGPQGGSKDPEVQQMLITKNNLKDGQYFGVRLHKIPDDVSAVRMPGPGIKFPEPNKFFWV